MLQLLLGKTMQSAPVRKGGDECDNSGDLYPREREMTVEEEYLVLVQYISRRAQSTPRWMLRRQCAAVVIGITAAWMTWD